MIRSIILFFQKNSNERLQERIKKKITQNDLDYENGKISYETYDVIHNGLMVDYNSTLSSRGQEDLYGNRIRYDRYVDY